MSPLPVRVIKLGGSLLDWPELIPNLRRWLARQPPATDIFIVGGGALVEQLRLLDQVRAISESAAHWLAIRAMSLTASLFADWFREATLATTLDGLRLSSAPGPQILDIEHFLRQDTVHANALPCGWQVTSDSIAARLATLLEAGELVLLKSTLPADGADRQTCAREGYVDAYFPRAAGALRIRCVDLRSDEHAQVLLN